MAQLFKIRMPDGKTYQPADWTAAEPLYSTIEIGVGAFPVLTAFAYPIGGAVPGSPGQRAATIADTNLEGEGARLPENEELIAYSLSIEVFMIGEEEAGVDALPPSVQPFVSLQNMLRLQRDLIILTKIAAVKEYTRSPMSWFPAGTGVFESNALAANAFPTNGGALEPYVHANNGGETVCAARNFASPLYVKGGETIAIDVRPGPGEVENLNLTEAGPASRMRLRLFFDGYRKRPVA
jgi:hypothetical protein